MAKQAWRLTGLWTKQLPSGGTLLSAKVPVAVLRDALQAAQDAGLHEVDVEVWEARDGGDRKPTHSLRIAEPFKPQQQAGPTWSNQRQDSPPAVEESYPF